MAAADKHASNGMCTGTNCDGPDVGGIRGAGNGHISSIKLKAGTMAGCAVGDIITAREDNGVGEGFSARVETVSSGAITKVRILSSGRGYSSVPLLAVSSASCTCNTAVWTNASAANGAACVQAMLGAFSDGGDACVAGGGGQEYMIVKDSAVAAAVASGVLRGSNYIEGGAYTTGPSAGSSQVRIKGAYLFPNDMHVAAAASVTNVQRLDGPDVTLNLQYLQVLVGGKAASSCTLYTFPRGVDPAQSNRSIGSDAVSSDISGLSELPEIRCAAPAGVGSGDLTVSWHGVAMTIAGWWKYGSPIVSSIQPAHVAYTGGALVTVRGENFGPKASWPVGGGGASLGVKGGRVDLLGWGVSSCALVVRILFADVSGVERGGGGEGGEVEGEGESEREREREYGPACTQRDGQDVYTTVLYTLSHILIRSPPSLTHAHAHAHARARAHTHTHTHTGLHIRLRAHMPRATAQCAHAPGRQGGKQGAEYLRVRVRVCVRACIMHYVI